MKSTERSLCQSLNLMHYPLFQWCDSHCTLSPSPPHTPLSLCNAASVPTPPWQDHWQLCNPETERCPARCKLLYRLAWGSDHLQVKSKHTMVHSLLSYPWKEACTNLLNLCLEYYVAPKISSFLVLFVFQLWHDLGKPKSKSLGWIIETHLGKQICLPLTFNDKIICHQTVISRPGSEQFEKWLTTVTFNHRHSNCRCRHWNHQYRKNVGCANTRYLMYAWGQPRC